MIFNELSKSRPFPVERKRRQTRFPNYSTQCGCRKSTRELGASCAQVQGHPGAIQIRKAIHYLSY
jgi:hypothetical protein